MANIIRQKKLKQENRTYVLAATKNTLKAQT